MLDILHFVHSSILPSACILFYLSILNVFCLLIRITIAYFSFDPNTLLCSHPPALILFVRVELFYFLYLIHSCVFVLYLLTSSSYIPRVRLRRVFVSSIPSMRMIPIVDWIYFITRVSFFKPSLSGSFTLVRKKHTPSCISGLDLLVRYNSFAVT